MDVAASAATAVPLSREVAPSRGRDTNGQRSTIRGTTQAGDSVVSVAMARMRLATSENPYDPQRDRRGSLAVPVGFEPDISEPGDHASAI